MDPAIKTLTEAVEKKVRSGLLAPMDGKGTSINVASQDDTSVTFNVGLVSIADLIKGGGNATMDWYIVQVARNDDGNSPRILLARPVALMDQDVTQIIWDAGLGTVTSCQRLGGGASSTTYVAWVDAVGSSTDLPAGYVVQLRLFGQVRSMDGLQNYIRAAALPDLPVPRTFPACSPSLEVAGLQLEITEYVLGPMANTVYYGLGDDMETRMAIVRQMARAHAGIWELSLPVVQGAKAVGDALFERGEEGSVGGGTARITVAPDRTLGGPFAKPSDFLGAWIRHRLHKLEDQNGVDEYKETLLAPIRQFVNGSSYNSGNDSGYESSLMATILSGKGRGGAAKTTAVDEVPVVLQHADLGLHNVILAPSDVSPPSQVRAIIDWEFTSRRPWVMAIDDQIEPLFERDERVPGQITENTPNSTSAWEGADRLRVAFWNEIPKWRELKETRGSTEFREWYGFGRDLKADAHPNPLATPAEKQAHWARNTRNVTAFLAKWGSNMSATPTAQASGAAVHGGLL